jgi:ribonuclease VapC
MIAVDTSALMAIALDEPHAASCVSALDKTAEVLISAGTMAETLVVAGRRSVTMRMEAVLKGYGFTIINFDTASARRVAEAYSRWGRGVHPAGLNLGDCFAYVVAKEHSCPLLFVGNDFSKTDLQSVL